MPGTAFFSRLGKNRIDLRLDFNNPGMAGRADLKNLSLLGKPDTRLPSCPEEAKLEVFPNQRPGRRYWITLNCPEFSSLCPVTGQPDSAPDRDPLRARRELRGNKEPQVLPRLVPQPAGVQRGNRQPHPRRPGRGIMNRRSSSCAASSPRAAASNSRPRPPFPNPPLHRHESLRAAQRRHGFGDGVL